MDTTSFKVEDLTEGDEYEFRVQAYNAAGPSRPSTTAGPILIQDQTCKDILFHNYIQKYLFSHIMAGIWISV